MTRDTDAETQGRERLLVALAEGDDPRVAALAAELHPADLAEVLDGLDETGPRLRLFGALPTETASKVFRDAGEAARTALIEHLDDVRLAEILEHLDTDDAADLIGEVPEARRRLLLQQTDPETRRDVAELLTYADDTAGGIMKTEVAWVRTGTLVGAVIDYLRRNADAFEDVSSVLVVDAARRPVGVASLRALILADERRRVDDVMDTELVTVRYDLDQEEVAHIFEKYDLLSAPVVDDADRLLGSITVDDVVDVIEEEATEDMLGLAGIAHDGAFSHSAVGGVRSRLPWLTVNLLTAALSALTIAMFEGTIRLVAVAAALMTVVASQGGNAGVQTMTLVVRGLAIGELEPGQLWKLVRRELAIASLNGLVLGTICGLAVFAWRADLRLGVVIAGAMFANLLVAATLGSAVPIVLKVARVDPAVASSVFVTAGTDVLGFLIFLGLLTFAL